MERATAGFWLLVVQFFTLVVTTAANLSVDARPAEIDIDNTATLDINCTFSLPSNMAAVVSLTLSQVSSDAPGQHYEDLATMTEFSPKSVTLLTQESVSSTGVLSQTAQSFLNLRWTDPSYLQAGVYQCTAQFLDGLGQTLVLTNTTSVSEVYKGNVTYMLEKLKATQINSSMVISTMENHIKALEKNISQMNSYITRLESTVSSFRQNCSRSIPLDRFDVIGGHNNSYYYVSKQGFGNIYEANAVCKVYDGFLAVIDNEDEFNTIKELLGKSAGNFQSVMVGGTDAESEGNWVIPETTTPLPFEEWMDGSPRNNTDWNCIMLNEQFSWKMNDMRCNISPQSDYIGYMCEKKDA